MKEVQKNEKTMYFMCAVACLLTCEMISASSIPVSSTSESQKPVVTAEMIQRIEAERQANDLERQLLKAKRRELVNQILAYNREKVMYILSDIAYMVKSDFYKPYTEGSKFLESIEKEAKNYPVQDMNKTAFLKAVLKLINERNIPLAEDKLSLADEDEIIERVKRARKEFLGY